MNETLGDLARSLQSSIAECERSLATMFAKHWSELQAYEAEHGPVRAHVGPLRVKHGQVVTPRMRAAWSKRFLRSGNFITCGKNEPASLNERGRRVLQVATRGADATA